MALDQGLATLVAAIVSAVFALVGLGVSLINQRGTIHIEKRLDMLVEIEQEKRKLIREQLSEFYDPIFALLSVNRNVFKRVGPNSLVRQDPAFPEDETGKVGAALVETVILPNNRRICDIIETKLYLLTPSDDIAPYLEFTTHAYAYQVFKEQPYEAYRLFQFPTGFLSYVQTQRAKLRDQAEKFLNSDRLI